MGLAINNVNDRRPVIEQCDGCDRVQSVEAGRLCSAFAFPETKWRLGPCSMATHVKIEVANKGGEKQRVGQQKQKKR
jgi:hypothetical protein